VAFLPKVVSPLKTLFVREAVEVALVSVELWPSQVIVRLAGLPSAATESRTRDHQAALDAWTRAARADRAAAGASPEEPGERVLQPLTLSLRDDSATEYWLRSAQFGGTGSEWRGDWFFEPGPPADARTLQVTFDAPDSPTTDVAIDLSTLTPA